MECLNGWIKLHRKYIDEDWYKDPKQRIIYIHLLLTAAHEPALIKGVALHPGQTITTLPELVGATGLTTKQVRLALKKLEQNSLVAVKRAVKFRIITIEKWTFEQGYNFAAGSQKGSQGQSKGQSKGQSDNAAETLKNEPFEDDAIAAAGSQKGSQKGREEIYNKKNIEEEREPPTLEDVKSYFLEKKFKSDPELFFSRYSGMGWKINGSPIEDWRFIANSWELREKQFSGPITTGSRRPTIEPPKYKELEPEPEVETVCMPKEIRESLNRILRG